MAENRNAMNQQQHQDVRRDDLKQQQGHGDTARTGSTGSGISEGEWKPGDSERNRTQNPETGSDSGTGTNAGNGGDFTDQ